jgi:hemolysin activation/secretion protein
MCLNFRNFAIVLNAGWVLSIAAASYAASVDPLLELKRQEERDAAQRQSLQRASDVHLQTEPAAGTLALPLNESTCFPISRIEMPVSEVEFKDVLSESLAHITPQPQGQCLGVQGINAVVSSIQNELIQQGYVTTRVLVPQQDLNGGVLQLQLIPGRIAAIQFKADPSIQVHTMRVALPMQEGDLLNLRDVEQALENLKRVPTAEADIQIEPADQPGQSNLVVMYQQKLPVRLLVSADDSGTKATGRYVGGVTLSIDNISRHNDLFYITQTKSWALDDGEPRQTRSTTVHYSIPLGYWTLALNANNSHYFQQIAGLNGPVIYSGQSENNDIKLSRLVWRDAQQKTTLAMRAWQRKSNNYIDDTEVGPQRRIVGGWEASANHKAMIADSTYEGTLAYKRGTGAFGSIASPEEAFGEGTSRMKVFVADASIKVPFDVAQSKWTYYSTWRGQYNQTPLTPQDRFSIGGRFTVRGFDGESILSAERGWLWRNEIGTRLGESGQELYVGLDQGQVTGPTSDLLVGRYLVGSVLGFRGSYQKMQYDVFVGTPVKNPDNFRTASYTAGFSVSVALDAN